MKSIILNEDNSVVERNESTTKFVESVEEYMGNNMERVANIPTYEQNERARRGKFVCSQLKALAEKGEAIYQQQVDRTEKELNEIMGKEVEEFSFVEKVKRGLDMAGFGTAFGKMVMGAMLFGLLLMGAGSIYQASANVPDTGTTVMTQDVGTAAGTQQEATSPVSEGISPKA